MASHTKRYYWWNAWIAAAIVILLVVATPVFTILINLFDAAGPQWPYISSRLFSHYFSGTVMLLVGVATCTFIVGVGMAWLVSVYDFPGRRWFEWLLILPLAFPAYMMAYSYVGLLEYTGPVNAFLRNKLGLGITGPIFDIMNMRGAIFVLSMSLFPYVYVFCRTSFLRRSREVQEAALLLGSGGLRTFFRISLPMARPAIAGSLALTSMEVLNDYGTVKYFGVDTFTTGIFRAWFSMGDISTGIRMAAILTLLVLLLIWLENLHRGKRAWTAKSGTNRPPLRLKLGGLGKWLAFSSCLGVLSLSFTLPFGQMSYWVWLTAHKVMNAGFWQIAGNSFLLASISALLITVVSIVLLYAVRLNNFPWLRYLAGLAVLGYAIPGAVIAIGIRIPVVALDQWLSLLFTGSGGLYLSLTLFMLIFAYIVRFMAVGYHAIDSGFQKTGMHVNEASRMLGASSLRTLWRIDLPLVKKSIGAGLLLVFVDVIKELPLTLILRPFNFHTLATKAFDMATNEQVAESANASLIVVLTGLVPVILLNNLIKNKE